jgi:hypothetical protein
MSYTQGPVRRVGAVVLLAVFLAAMHGAVAGDEDVAAVAREGLLKSAVRIRYERDEGGATITGHGTAFGVDLSRYGYTGRRYLLSAAHNVLDDNKRPFSTLKVEIEEGSRTYWSRSRAVVWDLDLDLCIVEAGDDMPCLLKLARSDLPKGGRVVLAGSPRGVPVKLLAGTVTQRFERGTVRFSATIPFDHGDSGGPMVDPATGAVVGIAVAGVPMGRDLDHTVGLFVPLVGITSFLEANSRGTPIPVAVPVEAPFVAVSPASQKPEQPVFASAETRPHPDHPAVAAVEPIPNPGQPAVAAPTPASPKPEQPPIAATATARPHPEHAAVAAAAEEKGAVNQQRVPLQSAEPQDDSVARWWRVAARQNIQPVADAAPAAEIVELPDSPRKTSTGAVGVAIHTEAPAARQEMDGTAPRNTTYTVQWGDSISKIARLHGVSASALVEANGLKDPNYVQAGMKLTIPK